MTDQRWMDAVQEAHRRGVPVAQVLGELARAEVPERFMALVSLFQNDEGELAATESLDFKTIGGAAERLLQAAAAADLLLDGATEIAKDMKP